MKRLHNCDPVWYRDENNELWPGRFYRYLGHGQCRVYLINEGVRTVPRLRLTNRRMRVDGVTRQILGPIAATA